VLDPVIAAFAEERAEVVLAVKVTKAVAVTVANDKRLMAKKMAGYTRLFFANNLYGNEQ
jgi:hypothetical protein